MTITDNQPKEAMILQPPRRRYPELAHLKNIDYFLEKLQNSSIPDPVLVYLKEKSISELHTYYRILPKEEAEKLKLRNDRFDYVTLEDFVAQKEAISSSNYILNQDGLIIGER
ncbi:MAG TPA: hypothetical protein VJJ75_02255 [Candidatus Nanoarchaeia archaeon]|nr:hypothetical protein [Candidatus Nanoarchaeia archaeon]